MSSGHRVDRPTPEALTSAEVLAEDGSRVRLGSTWADHPVVLVFVRHFG